MDFCFEESDRFGFWPAARSLPAAAAGRCTYAEVCLFWPKPRPGPRVPLENCEREHMPENTTSQCGGLVVLARSYSNHAMRLLSSARS